MTARLCLTVRQKTIRGERWRSKTGRNRRVPISSSLRQYLDAFEPHVGSTWFFTTPKGKRWDPDNFSHRLRKDNKANGLLSDLRRPGPGDHYQDRSRRPVADHQPILVSDNMNNLVAGKAAESGLTIGAYEGFGRRIKTTDPDGHYSKPFYDDTGRPTAIPRHNSGGTVLANRVTEYDTLGRVTKTRVKDAPTRTPHLRRGGWWRYSATWPASA